MNSTSVNGYGIVDSHIKAVILKTLEKTIILKNNVVNIIIRDKFASPL